MTPQEETALWRNRFILINLVRIGGTVGVLARPPALAERRLRAGRLDPRLPDRDHLPRHQLLRAEISRPPVADAGRSREALLRGRQRRRRPAHPARRQAGEDSGTARPRLAHRRARRGGRRRMERAGARRSTRAPCRSPASPTPRSTGSRRTRPPSRAASRLMANRTCFATAPKGRRRWWRARPRRWDPILAWARRRYDAMFEVDRGNHPYAPAGRDCRAAERGGRGARAVRARRPCRRW